jgi:hypothetical protein
MPMPIPNKIIAGDSVTWTIAPFTSSLGLITSAAWQLTYALRGPLPAGNVDVVGVAAGGSWNLQLSAAQTAALNTGATRLTWYWQASASNGTQRATVGSGQLFVSPNLAGLAIYEAINAEIKARVDGGVSVEYTIGNRSLKREPTAELLKLRSHYLTIISNERRAQQLAAGQGNPGRVGVRFK